MQPGNGAPFEVVIVGGGAAGLAAALVLGRMRRRVLLLDAGDPAHSVSDAVHGLFGHDGIPPLELRRIARDDLRPYDSVTVRDARVEEVRPMAGRFSVLADGETSEARVLLLATGLRCELPPIQGLAGVWGHGAYHCPYCHGWEVRDRPLAVYGTNAAGLAWLLTSLSDDVVLLTNGGSELDPDEAERLRQAGVVIRETPLARLEAEGSELMRIVFLDGSSDDRAGLFLMPSFITSPLPGQLGCELNESGDIVVDGDGRTSVPGVFAAGDATTDRKSAVLAAAAGSRAAYVINAELARGLLPVGDRSGRSA
jgi:thioredoxin reductase